MKKKCTLHGFSSLVPSIILKAQAASSYLFTTSHGGKKRQNGRTKKKERAFKLNPTYLFVTLMSQPLSSYNPTLCPGLLAPTYYSLSKNR